MIKRTVQNNASKFQKIINHLKEWLKNSHTSEVKNYYAYPHRNPDVDFFRYLSRDQSNVPLSYILGMDDQDELYLFQLNYENIIIVASLEDE